MTLINILWKFSRPYLHLLRGGSQEKSHYWSCLCRQITLGNRNCLDHPQKHCKQCGKDSQRKTQFLWSFQASFGCSWSCEACLLNQEPCQIHGPRGYGIQYKRVPEWTGQSWCLYQNLSYHEWGRFSVQETCFAWSGTSSTGLEGI